MSMRRFLLDAPVLSAHALLRALSKSGDRIIDAAAIKRKMLTKLVSEYMAYKQQSLELSIYSPACTTYRSDTNVEIPIPELQMLLETEGKNSVHNTP